MKPPLNDLEQEFKTFVEEERAELYKRLLENYGPEMSNEQILHALITEVASLKVQMKLIFYREKTNYESKDPGTNEISEPKSGEPLAGPDPT